MIRPTLNGLRQPDIILSELFPSLTFNVFSSVKREGHWFIYASKNGNRIGMFWDKRKGFPSDELVAQLALVA